MLNKGVIHILLYESAILTGAILGWIFSHAKVFPGIGAALFVIIVLTAFFFRDPERMIPAEAGIVVSPADGRIVSVKRFADPSFCDVPFHLVSIFLSLWDVHVNRVPISGRVTCVTYSRGQFLPAFTGKSSTRNEQNLIGIDGIIGRVFVKQIAGIVARRIDCRLREGDCIRQGERFGMIRFGSRVELYLPVSVKIRVTKGQRVKAGVSVVGMADEV